MTPMLQCSLDAPLVLAFTPNFAQQHKDVVGVAKVRVGCIALPPPTVPPSSALPVSPATWKGDRLRVSLFPGAAFWPINARPPGPVGLDRCRMVFVLVRNLLSPGMRWAGAVRSELQCFSFKAAACRTVSKPLQPVRVLPVADFWSEVDSLPGRLRGYSILYSSASDLPPAMPCRRANVARTFAEFIRGHTTAFRKTLPSFTCSPMPPHSLLPGGGGVVPHGRLSTQIRVISIDSCRDLGTT